MFKFVKLKEEHLEQVLAWRIKPEISKFLFTKVKNDINLQREWFDRVNRDPKYRYWIIEYQGQNIGVINLADIDQVSLRCNAGYYIGETQYNHHGGIILPYLYNHIFNVMKFNKIFGEVVEGNQIIKIHLLHGYTKVGTYHKHIKIEDTFHDVHLVELMAENWNALKRYRSYVAEFES